MGQQWCQCLKQILLHRSLTCNQSVLLWQANPPLSADPLKSSDTVLGCMIWPHSSIFIKCLQVACRPIIHIRLPLHCRVGLKLLIVLHFWPQPKQWFHSRCFALAVKESATCRSSQRSLKLAGVVGVSFCETGYTVVLTRQPRLLQMHKHEHNNGEVWWELRWVSQSSLKAPGVHMLWLAWIYFALAFFQALSFLQANDRWPSS